MELDRPRYRGADRGGGYRREGVAVSEHLKNGEFYAVDSGIFRAPIVTNSESGKSINVGFPVCTTSQYVDAADIVNCLNASRHHEAMVNALEELLRCGAAILGASFDDPEAKEAFEMYNTARNNARAALIQVKRP
jgi:hypothetical protein